MNPLNLAGPEFLSFYAGFVACSGALVWLIRRLLTPAGVVDARATDLDVYDLAYLGGGGERVVDAATVKLREEGILRVSGDDRLVLAGEVGTGAHRIERDVVQAVQDGTTPRLMRELIAARCGGIHERLRSMGLLTSLGEQLKIKLLTLIVVIPMVLVAATKLNLGLARGKPVFFLGLMLIGSVLLAVALMWWPARRTHAGNAVLSELKQRARGDAEPGPTAAALAVCAFGVAMMPADMQKLFAPPSTGAGGGGDSCGGDAGGGDGGCGGGCGGCGGCG